MLLSPVEDIALTATAAAAVAAIVADAALRPQSQLFGRTFIAPRRPGELALTFDDGPNDAATPQLLDLLAQHNTRATFFMIGRFVRERPDLARRVLGEGHVVGNHTMTHPWLSWQSGTRIRQELRDCNAALEDVLGAQIRYFRPPHGARRPAVLREARNLGLTVVQWNVMGQDWRPIGAAGILQHVQSGMQRAAKQGVASNILLHDGFDQAMGANRSDTISAVSDLLKSTDLKAVGIDAWTTNVYGVSS